MDLEEEYKDFEKNYINYFNDLENDFLSIRQYVAFEEDNFKTYSVKFLKIYLAVCGEIDNLGKKIAMDTNSSLNLNDLKNIHCWFNTIQNIPFNYEDNSVILKDFECNYLNKMFKPWDNYVVSVNHNNFIGQNTPKWWNEYNDVKHKRMMVDDNGILNYKKANLENVITAFTALYALILLCSEKYKTTKGYRRRAIKSKMFEKLEPMLVEEVSEVIDNILYPKG